MEISHFSIIYGTSHLNNKILFYGGHVSHFEDNYIKNIRGGYIHPLVLKDGYYGNNKPNKNGPDGKVKKLYNKAKDNWHQYFRTMKSNPSHMDYILVSAWD